jgi:hypothetical protein
MPGLWGTLDKPTTCMEEKHGKKGGKNLGYWIMQRKQAKGKN